MIGQDVIFTKRRKENKTAHYSNTYQSRSRALRYLIPNTSCLKHFKFSTLMNCGKSQSLTPLCCDVAGTGVQIRIYVSHIKALSLGNSTISGRGTLSLKSQKKRDLTGETYTTSKHPEVMSTL